MIWGIMQNCRMIHTFNNFNSIKSLTYEQYSFVHLPAKYKIFSIRNIDGLRGKQHFKKYRKRDNDKKESILHAKESMLWKVHQIIEMLQDNAHVEL